MHKIKLYNTPKKMKEVLEPYIHGKIGMYVCGPTVYELPHVGNARALIIFDVLYLLLIREYGEENVNYVRNITDVDDKINAKAKELNISIQDLTSQTIEGYHKICHYLNLQKPNIEPKATEHIGEIVSLIEILLKKGCAYESEGNIYFDISKYENYYNLSGRSKEHLREGWRIENDNQKGSPEDFILWKLCKGNEPDSAIFKSPWGPGRPGWHIECSSMSTKYLGETFDIHGGGIDLLFPHHTNEVAQSCSAFEGSQYARMWLHNGFVTINGQKMSKSLGNVVTPFELQKKGYLGESIRLLILKTHYRKPFDYTEEKLDQAQKELKNIYMHLKTLQKKLASSGPADEKLKTQTSEYVHKFHLALKDDVNTVAAISEIWNFINFSKNTEVLENAVLSEFIANKLIEMLSLLGLYSSNAMEYFSLNNSRNKTKIEPEQIEIKISERSVAKNQKNWTLADKIRNDLLNMGVELIDLQNGETKYKYN